jgi:hypothetical protein
MEKTGKPWESRERIACRGLGGVQPDLARIVEQVETGCPLETMRKNHSQITRSASDYVQRAPPGLHRKTPGVSRLRPVKPAVYWMSPDVSGENKWCPEEDGKVISKYLIYLVNVHFGD